MPSFTAYNAIFFVFLGGACACAAALHVYTDPFGQYEGLAPSRFGPYKAQLGSRRGKSEIPLRNACSTLVLGTSRAEMGIDPESPVFETGTACNMGLAGANMEEILAAYRYTLKHSNVERVIFLADFLAFNTLIEAPSDFEKSRLASDRPELEYRLDVAFRIGAAQNVLRMYYRDRKHYYTPLGHKSALSDGEMKPTRRLFRHNVLKAFGLVRYTDEGFDLYRELVRDCAARGIDLVVAVSPVHALELEAMHVARAWDFFEQWKRELTLITDEESKGAAPVWDFSGYTPYTTEPVPFDDKIVDGMKWHWESSHFKRALGDIVLGQLLGEDAPNTQVGERMTTATIERHLQKIRSDRAAWVNANRAEVQWVRSVAQEVIREQREQDAPL